MLMCLFTDFVEFTWPFKRTFENKVKFLARSVSPNQSSGYTFSTSLRQPVNAKNDLNARKQSSRTTWESRRRWGRHARDFVTNLARETVHTVSKRYGVLKRRRKEKTRTLQARSGARRKKLTRKNINTEARESTLNIFGKLQYSSIIADKRFWKVEFSSFSHHKNKISENAEVFFDFSSSSFSRKSGQNEPSDTEISEISQFHPNKCNRSKLYIDLNNHNFSR